MLGLVAVMGLTACASSSGSGAASTGSRAGSGRATVSSPSAAGAEADPATAPGTRTIYQQKPTWRVCSAELPAAFECAKVMVPVDWAAPAGETIGLALLRHKATGKRKGSLLLNPGGPGASGVEFALSAADALGKSVVASYDLVGWDPRGVGASHGVKCLSDAEMDTYLALEARPGDTAAQAQVNTWTKRFYDSCRKNTGPVIDHVDTASTVQDLDVIRGLLGDEKINFYGASYGTYIGARYAQTFPARVGRIVLDSVDDPTVTQKQALAEQAASFEATFDIYLDECGKRSGCPLKAVPAAQRKQKILGLIASVYKKPLTTRSPRKLTSSLLRSSFGESLYSHGQWPALDAGLVAAFRGDGTALLAIADRYSGRRPDGTYPSLTGSLTVINCLDKADPRTDAERKADTEELSTKYPIFGQGDPTGTDPCTRFGGFRGTPVQALDIKVTTPLLIVATRHDPATPYSSAQHVATMVSNHRLITVEGSGHAAYPGTTSACLAGAVDTFLVEGTPPAADITCAA